jgi:dynein heavy chain
LIELDALYTALDESLAQINMILGNRYVKVMRLRAEGLKKKLSTLVECIAQWSECQKQWCYLENIF